MGGRSCASDEVLKLTSAGLIQRDHLAPELRVGWTSSVASRKMNGLCERIKTMASCSAGECDCECPGKGCACIALSDSPVECDCHCYGSGLGGGLTLELNALVDVSISGLPLKEAARFLNSVHSEQILVPADLLNNLNKRVHLKVKRKRFTDVLKSLGLATNIQRKKKTSA
jgi:hypothetical protein